MEIHAQVGMYIGLEAEQRAKGSRQSSIVKRGKSVYGAVCFTGQQCETVTQLSKNHYVDIGRRRCAHTSGRDVPVCTPRSVHSRS